MPESFDPYFVWLEIPPEEQPPNHYRLLGIEPFEDRLDVIERAAEQRVGRLHAFQTGERAKSAVRLLNEVAAAKVCLLNANRKAGYDAGLQQMLQAKEAEAGKTDANERARCTAFLQVLEEKDLLPRSLLESLRKQVSTADRAVSAKTVAGRLIEKKHLTPALAKRLLAAAEERYVPPVVLPPPAPMPLSVPIPTAPVGPTPSDSTGKDDDTELEDLDLAPLEEDRPAKRPSPPPEEELDFAPLEDDKRAKRTTRPKPTRPAVEKKAPAQSPKQTQAPQKAPPSAPKTPPPKTPPPSVPKTPPPPAPQAPASESAPQRPAKTPEPPAEPPAAPAANGSLLEEELRAIDGEAAGAGMGPLDGLMAGASIDDDAGGGPLMPVKSKRKGLGALFARKKKLPAKRKENVWDSPLILLGGGALLLLLILFAVLYWALARGSGEDAFAEAEGEYQDGRYTQAIHKYEQYLKDYPHHADVSKAKVNCGLAKLRKATKQRESTNWVEAHETAKKVLKDISSEPEFPSAHNDLWAILPTIAAQLAEQARENPDPKLVALAEDTLALTNKYVPRRLRTGERLEAIRETLNYVERELARGMELDGAIEAMKKAAADGNTQEAYAVHGTLLSKYPMLDDPRLDEALLEVSRAQQAAVKFVAQRTDPIAAGAAAAPRPVLVLAQRITPGNAATAGKLVFASAGTAVYALDAATGQVRWRYPVGVDPNRSRPPFPPTPIVQTGGSTDVIAVDPARRELLCLKSATGDARWRHPIGEPFDAHPVIADGSILVATRSEDGRSGRLVIIDAATGVSEGYIHLPQPLHVAPTVDLSHSPPRIFQPADHSNLFVLSWSLGVTLEDGRCEHVFHLGHQRDSIAAPAAVFQNLLMLAVNEGIKSSTLRIFSVADGEQGVAVTPVQQFALDGRVDTAPLTSDLRVLVVTDRGVASIYDFGDLETDQPLKQFPQTTAPDDRAMTRLPLFPGRQFYIADSRLSHYEIQSSQRRLALQWRVDDRCAFLQPPVAVGKTIVAVRRKVGIPGAFVAAVAATEDDPNRLWETHLAAPPAGEPIVDAAGGKISIVSALGAFYQVDAAALQARGVLDRPAAAVNVNALTGPIDCVVRLPGGLLAMTAGEGSTRIAVVDPARPALPQQFSLPKALTCRPVAFAGGVLAPTQGAVFLIDPRTGEDLAKPFPPELEAGVQLAWREPAPIGPSDAPTEAVLTDGRTKLYRMGLNDKPLPHLISLAEVDLPRPIVSPLAAAATVVYGVDQTDTLAAFALPDLTRTDVRRLSGRCVWGPLSVGDRVMLATDDGQLLCLGPDGKVAWQQPLPYGTPVGAPLETAEGYVLASTAGVVWCVGKTDGEPLRRGDEPRQADLGRPLGAGPVALGDKLLVVQRDGSLQLIEQP